LNFINVVILPYDLFIVFIWLNQNYQRVTNKTEYEELNNKIKLLWTILYWIIFFNSWLIIPIVQDYEKSGDFNSKDKLKRAIKTNVLFYVIMLTAGVIFILYLMIKKNLTGKNLIAFLVALSNAW
jgi:succinate dehydrogenase hydrophobic anchor subunit